MRQGTLASLERPWRKRIAAVGDEAADRILAQARAMASGSEIVLGTPAIPADRNYAMFDLEGIPPQLDELEKVYLWGLQVFGEEPGEFEAALAGLGSRGDREGWEKFLALAEEIFDAYSDLPFVHLFSYEPAKLSMDVERFGDRDGVADRIRCNLLDLLPITRAASALPLPSSATEAEWRRINEQDGALFVVAAFTGLRLGELLALRWSDVDFANVRLTVTRAMSAGEETSTTKSRRFRTVPLADQAAAELERISRREHFTARRDLVFCRPDGGPLDRSSVRKRFLRAQAAAGLRVRRFHDLRHTFGSLAVRSFDSVSVQAMMGHSKLTTTERYLHSKPRADDAAKLTSAFGAESVEETEGAEARQS